MLGVINYNLFTLLKLASYYISSNRNTPNYIPEIIFNLVVEDFDIIRIKKILSNVLKKVKVYSHYYIIYISCHKKYFFYDDDVFRFIWK